MELSSYTGFTLSGIRHDVDMVQMKGLAGHFHVSSTLPDLGARLFTAGFHQRDQRAEVSKQSSTEEMTGEEMRILERHHENDCN